MSDEKIMVDMDSIEETTFLKTGRFWCVCTDAHVITGQRGDPGIELTWTALFPEPAKGRTTKDRLWATGDKVAARLKLACRALGLRVSGSAVEVGPDDFIGKQVWLQIDEGKPWIGRDGKERKSWQVGYDGYDGASPAPARPTEKPAPF